MVSIERERICVISGSSEVLLLEDVDVGVDVGVDVLAGRTVDVAVGDAVDVAVRFEFVVLWGDVAVIEGVGAAADGTLVEAALELVEIQSFQPTKIIFGLLIVA